MKATAGKILMLVENPFPEDPRVRREAYTLAENGYQVSVIALRWKENEPRREILNGVTVYRIPTLQVFKKGDNFSDSLLAKLWHRLSGLLGYLAEYVYFTLACLVMSLYVLFREGFDVIHAHNPPDTLFMVGAFYKLLGKKFVFDHHDLSPELYMSRFGVRKNVITRALFAVENLCFRTADLVIATNQSYRRIALERGRKKPEEVFIVRNGPDLNRVKRTDPDPRLKSLNKTILGYVGAINPQDGVDYLLRAVQHLVYELKRRDFYCVIVGSGDARRDLETLAEELQIQDYVWFTGYVSHEDKLRYLSTADICLDPDPSSPLNDKSTWIKIMEYMALGKPIVSFDLPETRYSARETALYARPNDEREFARAIITLMDDPRRREKMGAYGYRRVTEELSWEHLSQNLLCAYASLFGTLPQPAPSAAPNGSRPGAYPAPPLKPKMQLSEKWQE